MKVDLPVRSDRNHRAGCICTVTDCCASGNDRGQAMTIRGQSRSSPELVGQTLKLALEMSVLAGAHTVAFPMPACGYGNLEIADFARGLLLALSSNVGLEDVRVVVRRSDLYPELQDALERQELECS